MKKWILFIATILTLCSSVARADDFDDAITAGDSLILYGAMGNEPALIKIAY